ncbi:MAG: chloramphenicol acetyltransferase [Phaeodactylibacter sp.]|nr:chloramphenicol acetyltransferase [Phaeodactylibacter sp.]MCB9264131.1 chloramphenicol acetyltransferase [Lewinellaceae bacterium]MCB9286751.1 chloramphenicol acetyltransferase [Lewinellaceae bacterium]
MKIVHFSDEHRRKHYEFFRNMSQPHFNICSRVDISRLLPVLKKRHLRFTPTIVYCVARAANDIPAFRQRIRGEQVVEHEVAHPSFTVLTEISEVFSFCTVTYQSGYSAFSREALSRIEAMQQRPSMEDEKGRDDYLYLSAFPWVSFTSVQHAMHYDPVDSVPRIAWGKFFEETGKTWLPLSVQAHHGLVDGRHMGRFFENIQFLLSQPEIFL